MQPDLVLMESIIKNALLEDVKEGDITTDNIIPIDKMGKAELVAKEEGIIAGLTAAEMVFLELDPEIIWEAKVNDGDHVVRGDVIVEFSGKLRALLTGERLALNLLQRMSGIATETAKYVAKAEGTKTKILDTRKTAPGLRHLDKYAVTAGGGTNHREGLYDMVMIKDNHITAAGSISEAVRLVRPKIPKGIRVEVETTNLNQVKEAFMAGADIIMLDNMTDTAMAEAVKFLDGKVRTEASGNMTLDRIEKTAGTGVDFISVGALTHSVRALDISQYIVSG